MATGDYSDDAIVRDRPLRLPNRASREVSVARGCGHDGTNFAQGYAYGVGIRLFCPEYGM